MTSPVFLASRPNLKPGDRANAPNFMYQKLSFPLRNRGLRIRYRDGGEMVGVSFRDSKLRGHTVGDVSQKVGYLEVMVRAKVSHLGVCLLRADED